MCNFRRWPWPKTGNAIWQRLKVIGKKGWRYVHKGKYIFLSLETTWSTVCAIRIRRSSVRYVFEPTTWRGWPLRNWGSENIRKLSGNDSLINAQYPLSRCRAVRDTLLLSRTAMCNIPPPCLTPPKVKQQQQQQQQQQRLVFTRGLGCVRGVSHGRGLST